MNAEDLIGGSLGILLFGMVVLIYFGLRAGIITERGGVVLIAVLPNALVGILAAIPLVLFASPSEARAVLAVLVPFMSIATLAALFAWGPMTGKPATSAFRVLCSRTPLVKRAPK